MKVMCADCETMSVVPNSELDKYICPQCGCDDYKDWVPAKEPNKVIIRKTPAKEEQVEVETNNNLVIEEHKEEFMENEIEEEVKDAPSSEEVAKQLGGLVTDLSSIVRNCDVPINKLSFDYEIDDVEVEVIIRRP